jgi:hypothetical protein
MPQCNTALKYNTTVTKSKEVRAGLNLIESSKEGYGSKNAVLPMMMIMMILIDCNSLVG